MLLVMLRGFALMFAAFVLGGCASGMRIYADDVPQGALRLGQVVSTASRVDIKQKPQTYQALLASGIKDSDIANGSLGVASVLCCGGPAEHATDLFFYIPPGNKLGSGDIVEIRSGQPAKDGQPGFPSTFVRVVEKRNANESHCQWDPPSEYNWKRIIYCDWMPKAGWIEPGLYPVWYKK